MKATIIIDAVHYVGNIDLVPEVSVGTCEGCIFDKFKTGTDCPKDRTGKLLCSSYTAGPTGIYVFQPGVTDG